jgi:hypothetical protein
VRETDEGETRVPAPPESRLVEALSTVPSGPEPSRVTVTGLFGYNDDRTKWRAYFSSQLDTYAEFNPGDVLRKDEVPPAHSPVPGEVAWRFTLKRGSQVDLTYTRTRSLTSDDQFELDVQLANPWLNPLHHEWPPIDMPIRGTAEDTTTAWGGQPKWAEILRWPPRR